MGKIDFDSEGYLRIGILMFWKVQVMFGSMSSFNMKIICILEFRIGSILSNLRITVKMQFFIVRFLIPIQPESKG